MSNTPELDRAIDVADKALEDYVSDPNNKINMVEYGRIHARALIAELLRDMDESKRNDWTYGFNTALAEIKLRAGLEGEG